MDAKFDSRRPFRSSGWLQLGGLCIVLAALGGHSPPVRAADGCLVLLCFAAPSWRSIPQCVPPIRQVLRDLSRGRPFPHCSMAGAGNSARHAWAHAPHNCPPQYTHVVYGDSAPTYYCGFRGAVSVVIDGVPFTRTWWGRSGETVTEYMPAAKTQFGTWDTRFDNDYAVWLASQPPAPTANDFAN